MKQLLKVEIWRDLVVFVALDLVYSALGNGRAGLSAFCSVFSRRVGHWQNRVAAVESAPGRTLRKTLYWAISPRALLFPGMLMLWSPCATTLLDPASDLTRLGALLILYESRTSFIG